MSCPIMGCPTKPGKGSIENLPQELKLQGKYCCWKYGYRNNSDKQAKVPHNPLTGYKLDIGRLDLFVTFEDVKNYADLGYDGIGISISDGISAIDIDHCIDDNGNLSAPAEDIRTIMNSYTEVSPSGHGLRILFMAENFQYDTKTYFINNQSLGLEVYVSGATTKYVTVTGNALPDSNGHLQERSAELQTVLDKYMRRPISAPTQPCEAETPSASPIPDDEKLIDIASRGKNGEAFKALMAGDTSGYGGNHSDADLALCGLLAFYTAKNPEQMDRIFRSSKLMRTKWDERRRNTTYGKMTIQKAIDQQASVFQEPPGPDLDEIKKILRSVSAPVTQPQTGCVSAPPPPQADLPAPVLQPQAGCAGQVAQQQSNSNPQTIQQQPNSNPPVTQQQAGYVQGAQQQPVNNPPVTQSQPTNTSLAPPQQANPPSLMFLTSAAELQRKALSPISYLVEDILPLGGVVLLSGSPKTGKSWACMGLSVAIATGQEFLGFQATQAGVLYLALEDNESRLQTRLNQILNNRPAPDNFYLINRASSLGDKNEPLSFQLDHYLTLHPDIKLIIIDTFQKIRGESARGESVYAYDYREMGAIKSYADNHNLTILVVHHNRKMKDEYAFNLISGSNGLLGAVDACWLFDKDKAFDHQLTFNITGRDVEAAEYVIEFNQDTCCWDMIGPKDDVLNDKQSADYINDPIVQAIKSALAFMPCWRGTASDLLKIMPGSVASGYNPQSIGFALRKLKEPLLKNDNITYKALPTNGSGGKVHEFVRATVQVSAPPATGGNVQLTT